MDYMYGVYWGIAICCGSLFSFWVAEAREEHNKRAVIGCVFIALLCYIVSGLTAQNYGKRSETTFASTHHYIVKKKSDNADDKFLLVYDMIDKKNRVIDFEGYPPNGFSEVFTVDGKVMLIPK
ncbi:MAG: hypothetical protein AAB497_01795 [Patescibacteria group bacterium]